MKKQMRSMTAITWLLIISIMGTWLLSMISLTVVTAQEIYDRLYDKSEEFPRYVNLCSHFGEYYEKNSFQYGQQRERPDLIEYNMLKAISMNTGKQISSNDHYAYSGDEYERRKLIRDTYYPMETAVLFYDKEWNLLHSTDDDVLFFHYYTKEEWEAGADCTAGQNYGWIDLKKEPEEGIYDLFRDKEEGTGPLHMEYPIIRVTGTIEGNEIKPVSFHYVTRDEVRNVVESTDQFSNGNGGYSYSTSEVDRTGKLNWITLYDNRGEKTEQNLATYYIEMAENWTLKEKSFRYNGAEYESLVKYTKQLPLSRQQEPFYYQNIYQDASKYKLNELMMFSAVSYGDYGEGEGTEYIMVTATRSNPIACAFDALRNIYLLTGIAMICFLLWARNSIKERLIQPVNKAIHTMENGWKTLYLTNGTSGMWKETAEVCENVKSEIDYRRMKENETARLEKALNYAQTAEENRRKMTSAIAHELKTPIAIIHSYAEGLKEHIAEDKRDQYVEVILSETERIDGMVLEMLDLSRLEAGKIKLSRDEFSMKELTESVFAKLERAAKAKNLKISFEIPDLFIVIADENRIGQVIENFATNAIKYTKPGGKVDVQIWKERSKTVFAIENESEPLSDQALSKVWETFYRADESRQGTGTGLGLAIAKNIVELHGGQCFVRNTKGGVEFKFRI